MRKNIVVLIILMLIGMSTVTYAINEKETIEEHKQNFGIGTFIKNAEQYKGEFFEGTDINKVLEDALSGNIDNTTFIKKIINLLGKEFRVSIKNIFIILIIIIIHSVLKSISEGLENNNISNIIYYVQYILITTIILSNFSDIITSVKETTANLVGFINLLIPLLTSLMMYTGSITTSSLIEPIILFSINFISNLIQNVLIPVVLIIASLSIISKISDKIQLDKISKMMKSGVTWLLGVVLTVFVGIVSLEGTLSSSVDGITAKTTKAVVSSAIPVVGKILGDTVDTVLGCGVILKNALGVLGILIVIGICIVPILKLGVLTICYKLLAGTCEVVADKKIVGLLDQIGDIFKILLAILSSISVMLIIGITLIIKISNSGMMYR